MTEEIIPPKGKRGGFRPNAGRPNKNKFFGKVSQEVAVRLIKEGMTPLDVILDNMRYFYQLAQLETLKIAGQDYATADKEIVGNVFSLRSLAQQSAKEAAPFMHSRLAAIEANVNVSNVEAELAELE